MRTPFISTRSRCGPATAPCTRPTPASSRAPGSHSARCARTLARFLKVDPARCVKTLIVEGSGEQAVALVVRGDHELNAFKAQKVAGVASPLRMASAERVLRATGAEPGYVGVVGLECRVYADH